MTTNKGSTYIYLDMFSSRMYVWDTDEKWKIFVFFTFLAQKL